MLIRENVTEEILKNTCGLGFTYDILGIKERNQYGMRILGVDFGVARTGVAVSDELGLTAQGVATIHNRNVEKISDEIIKYVKNYNAGIIVLGLPKNMNNTIGERGEATLAFAEILKTKSECEVVMWDERLSTVSAINALNETNTRGSKRKAVVDTVAATIILQNYLDYIRR